VSYFATGPITVAQLEALVPRIAVKDADEPITSSTTLQDDDDLTISVSANVTYAITGWLSWVGNGTGDIKFAWNAPAGATLSAQIHGPHGALVDGTGNGSVEFFPAWLGVTSFPTSAQSYGASTTVVSGHVKGLLEVGANAGNLTLQWAQNVSNGTSTIVKAKSWLWLQQVVSY
jgi:hypothetical protein